MTIVTLFFVPIISYSFTSPQPAPANSSSSEATTQTRVHFISVGFGDAILIQTNQQNILIDGGKEADGDTVVAYLKKSGVEKIDLLIATHPDQDHAGGLPKVIKTFPIGEILYNGKSKSDNESFITLMNPKGCPVTTATAGMEYRFGQAVLEILGPVIDDPESINNNSIVSKLTCGKVRFLFTGDAEWPEQESMLDKPVEADILKAPHHGIVFNPYDNTISQNERFLKKVAPQVVVVSRPADAEDIRFALNWPLMVGLYNKCGIHQIRDTKTENNICIETDGTTYQ